ncbi:hypothetical protein HHK36_001143 [Tetracentron sinense]|uniref:Uncharacterized protein n=1 Tax=Tetracentron sinense TaxID=13715 RepID=A0A835A345_TETSI|nr:hypothetical protein HHK36_001143 [Tetracentron sinense]
MEENPNDSSTQSETLIPEPDQDLLLTSPQNPSGSHDDPSESKPSFDQNEIYKAIEVVERDSTAIAESFTSLFSSLRLALSEVTGSSVDHMHCFSDVAGRLQESGNRKSLGAFFKNIGELDEKKCAYLHCPDATPLSPTPSVFVKPPTSATAPATSQASSPSSVSVKSPLAPPMSSQVSAAIQGGNMGKSGGFEGTTTGGPFGAKEKELKSGGAIPTNGGSRFLDTCAGTEKPMEEQIGDGGSSGNGIGLAGNGSRTLEFMNESFLFMGFLSFWLKIITLISFKLKNPSFFMDSE